MHSPVGGWAVANFMIVRDGAAAVDNDTEVGAVMGAWRGRVLVAALLAVAGLAGVCATASAAQHDGGGEAEASAGGATELRIAARRTGHGPAEFAFVSRLPEGPENRRMPAPQRRFIAANTRIDVWRYSSSVTLPVRGADGRLSHVTLRIAARNLADGRVEFGFQQRHPGGNWGSTVLPPLRLLPPWAPIGHWQYSSPLVLPNAVGDESAPLALRTTTGIPVAVLESTATGYVVRTPCGNAAEVAGGWRVDPVQVVLDPGHGGAESGAVGPNGLWERDLNLRLVAATLGELSQRGIRATTTRTGNYTLGLRVRTEFANALDAEALISVHHNAPTHRARTTPGTEVYVQSLAPDVARPESARLGGLLYEEITAALGAIPGVSWSGLSSAGVLRVLDFDGFDTYTLVRRPTVPAVLVEYGYLSNPSEAQLFATSEYLRIAAVATADAIEAYLTTDRAGTGHVAEPRVFEPTPLRIGCDDVTLEPSLAPPQL